MRGAGRPLPSAVARHHFRFYGLPSGLRVLGLRVWRKRFAVARRQQGLRASHHAAAALGARLRRRLATAKRLRQTRNPNTLNPEPKPCKLKFWARSRRVAKNSQEFFLRLWNPSMPLPRFFCAAAFRALKPQTALTRDIALKCPESEPISRTPAKARPLNGHAWTHAISGGWPKPRQTQLIFFLCFYIHTF